MIRIAQIKIRHEEAFTHTTAELSKSVLLPKVCARLKLPADKIASLTISRHSVDARKKPDIYDVYTVDVVLQNTDENQIVKKCRSHNITLLSRAEYKIPQISHAVTAEGQRRPVIVGSGPAGLFAAYVLAQAGLQPLLIERGKDITSRKADVESFWAGKKLNEESNVQFGEGGAGTFSDGKLYTGTSDRNGRQRFVTETFVQYGADESILYESNPHIGTDRLADVVIQMRHAIIARGGEVMFSAGMTDLILNNGVLDGIRITSTENEQNDKSTVIKTDTLVLAIGHSARDTFRLLRDRGVAMEKKPFAVGLRVAHPQEMINTSMYGVNAPATLPPSPYKLTTRTFSGRGVYSFCMCPGGFIVNASSEEGYTCVNGMSYSARDGRYANSAVVVTVTPEDFEQADVLAGCTFQRELEKKAYQVGRGKVPVGFLGAFMEEAKNELRGQPAWRQLSAILEKKPHDDGALSLGCIRPEEAVRGLVVEGDIYHLLPCNIRWAIAEGMRSFGSKIRGFDDDKVLLAGVETRTSSPVRMIRGDDYQSINVRGLYPCGEGAGYAGGIMSAAADGIKIAEAVIRQSRK